MATEWVSKLKADPTEWLLQSNPWTTYRTRLDLFDEPKDSPRVVQAKNQLLQHKKIVQLIAEASNWFPVSYTRHNDAKISHYKLRMLADFGLTVTDKNIHDIVIKATTHVDNGLFSFRQELPEKGKGFAKPNPMSNEWHALPCDAPLITSILLSLGHKSDDVLQTIDIIKEKWSRAQGWFCHFFFVESMFKKLQIGCPMTGLMALEVFSQIPELRESVYAQNAYEPIRFHRDYGKSIYYFGRSKKFWTFKYPFVWYNALYLAFVLSRFEFLKQENLVKELIHWIIDSQDENGRFKPTSMFMIYKDWDFGNKKEPSPWMTYLCCRILKAYFS